MLVDFQLRMLKHLAACGRSCQEWHQNIRQERLAQSDSPKYILHCTALHTNFDSTAALHASRETAELAGAHGKVWGGTALASGCVKQAAGTVLWLRTWSRPHMFSTALMPCALAACASMYLPAQSAHVCSAHWPAYSEYLNLLACAVLSSWDQIMLQLIATAFMDGMAKCSA